MKSRIAVTIEQFWHRIPGGTERATRQTISAMVNRDTFELIGLAAFHRKKRVDRAHPPIDVKFAKLPRPLLYEAWLGSKYPKIESITGPVDAVWAGAMVVPPPSAPIVATVHDLDFLANPDRLTKRGRSFFPRAWAATKANADRIVCPSKAVADDCIANGVDAGRVRVVPWGVRSEPVRPDLVPTIVDRYRLPEKFALWVGTKEPRKNLPKVVEAFRSLPDLPLVVVGPGGWQVSDEEVFGPLGDQAYRLGRIPEFDLRHLYAAAEVFVFPSLAEGFGLPVLEAMAQGTPVVTSRNTATAEVAGNAALLVNPLEAEEIAEAVKKIVSSGDYSSQLVEKGRRRARTMSWDATAAGYEAVFNEVIDR